MADRSDRQWLDAGVLIDRIPNNGKASLDITFEDLKRLLTISDKLLKKTFVVFRADVVEPLYIRVQSRNRNLNFNKTNVDFKEIHE